MCLTRANFDNLYFLSKYNSGLLVTQREEKHEQCCRAKILLENKVIFCKQFNRKYFNLTIN